MMSDNRWNTCEKHEIRVEAVLSLVVELRVHAGSSSGYMVRHPTVRGEGIDHVLATGYVLLG